MRYNQLRKIIEKKYSESSTDYKGCFGTILCYEIHSNPVNPRMLSDEKGLTFKELAQKWGISISLLGELIADHCKRLEEK